MRRPLLVRRPLPVTTGIALLSALLMAACLSPKQGAVGDTAAPPDATADDTADPDPDDTAVADTTRPPDTATADTSRPDDRPDAGTDLPELPCECPAGEVYRHAPCVPTLALGCGPPCAGDDDCGGELECAGCAASTTCATRDCQPSCAVPYAPHALIPEPLRIEPTRVREGVAGQISISGTSFYVGALGHSIRLGDKVLTQHGGFSGDSCQATVAIPEDASPGAHTIWVSQYSGGEPWVLAGILHVAAEAPVCAQPGFPCAGAEQCCTAPEITMTCRAGRCQRP